MSESEFDLFLARTIKVTGSLSADQVNLMRRAWHGCLDAARSKMPTEMLANWGDETDRMLGWNRCLSVMDERLSSLRSQEPGDER